MRVPTRDSEANVGGIHELPLQKTLPEGWALASIYDIAEVNPRIDKSQIPDDLLVSFVPMPAVGAGNGYIDVSGKKPWRYFNYINWKQGRKGITVILLL